MRPGGQYGAGECRCAARSTRRKCRSVAPVRHWSGSAPASTRRSRARLNVVQSRDRLLIGRRLGKRAAVAIEHLIDLIDEVLPDHLITNNNGLGKAFGVRS